MMMDIASANARARLRTNLSLSPSPPSPPPLLSLWMFVLDWHWQQRSRFQENGLRDETGVAGSRRLLLCTVGYSMHGMLVEGLTALIRAVAIKVVRKLTQCHTQITHLQRALKALLKSLAGLRIIFWESRWEMG